MERMSALQPLWVDITWGVQGSTSALTLEIAKTIQRDTSVEVMIHLTCTNMTQLQIDDALSQAFKAGVRNILALRGDPSDASRMPRDADGGIISSSSSDRKFNHAIDLVKYIREVYGDHFGIAVAGHPEGHAESTLEESITHLKAKVDAGADFIVTQLFYDCSKFLSWMDMCRAANITCPIIPGIMPLHSFSGLDRMMKYIDATLPDQLAKDIEGIKDDDAAIKALGVQVCAKMCKRLLQTGKVHGFHFYTLNLERSTGRILESLGLVTRPQLGELPWTKGQASCRKHENVRPIYWSNRPLSYLDRTSGWDEFPNGRWGDSSSPAFGEFQSYHVGSYKLGRNEEDKKLWGAAPTTPKEIFDVFVNYVQGKITRLPWCESLQLETLPLQDMLVAMNSSGLLTINSQPRVNGTSSSDPRVGWGGPGGYVYQKAYIEFFTSPSILAELAAFAQDYKSITFEAYSVDGTRHTNLPLAKAQANVTALTWGVFPNKEIIQPTIADSQTFRVWKDEAFALWKSQWQVLYEEGSASYALVDEICGSYFLVTVIDNDYVNGDISSFFWKFLESTM
jgi:methylenetetrahydrofolate reductase (NADPH)